MSKAFTREDEGSPPASQAPYTPPWPDGARNYLTRKGYERLRRELDELASRLPELAREAAADEARGAALAEAQRRAQILTVHLDAAEIVPPPSLPVEQAQLGTVVTVHDEEGRAKKVALVGIDEVDLARGHVGWASPLGRALTGARVGEIVTVSTPRGDEELEVVAIEPLDEA